MMFCGKEHFKIRVILYEQIILRTKPDTEYIFGDCMQETAGAELFLTP